MGYGGRLEGVWVCVWGDRSVEEQKFSLEELDLLPCSICRSGDDTNYMQEPGSVHVCDTSPEGWIQGTRVPSVHVTFGWFIKKFVCMFGGGVWGWGG